MVGQTDLFRTGVTPLLSPALPHPPALPRRQGGTTITPRPTASPPCDTAVPPGPGGWAGHCEHWAAECVTWVRAENLPGSQQ